MPRSTVSTNGISTVGNASDSADARGLFSTVTERTTVNQLWFRTTCAPSASSFVCFIGVLPMPNAPHNVHEPCVHYFQLRVPASMIVNDCCNWAVVTQMQPSDLLGRPNKKYIFGVHNPDHCGRTSPTKTCGLTGSSPNLCVQQILAERNPKHTAACTDEQPNLATVVACTRTPAPVVLRALSSGEHSAWRCKQCCVSLAVWWRGCVGCRRWSWVSCTFNLLKKEKMKKLTAIIQLVYRYAT